MVGAAPVTASSISTTAWIVTTKVSGGQTRRRLYLTRHGARTAAERDLAAGRAATISRGKLFAPAPPSDITGGAVHG